MMDSEVFGLIVAIGMLAAVLIAHLVAFVWWAAKLTTRVDHIETFITAHQTTLERLSALESSLRSNTEELSGVRDDLRGLAASLLDHADHRKP